MLIDLTEEDIRNLLMLINRVQITGAEALPVVILRSKLEAGATPQPSGAGATNGAAGLNRAGRRREGNAVGKATEPPA